MFLECLGGDAHWLSTHVPVLGSERGETCYRLSSFACVLPYTKTSCLCPAIFNKLTIRNLSVVSVLSTSVLIAFHWVCLE
jgi:hypothetical protein